MPISIRCISCGKTLKVRDELVGKNIKCPACGTVSAATPMTDEADPRSIAARRKPKEKMNQEPKGGTKLALNWGWLSLIAFVVLVVVGVVLFVVGPRARLHDWENI